MQYVYYNTMEENNKEHTNIHYILYTVCTVYLTKWTGVYLYYNRLIMDTCSNLQLSQETWMVLSTFY